MSSSSSRAFQPVAGFVLSKFFAEMLAATPLYIFATALMTQSAKR